MSGVHTGFHEADESGQPCPAPPVRPYESVFVCVDPVSRALDQHINSLATRHTTVLVYGESGVGKEHVAREIHRRSPRSAGPFVAVDCSSFSETLIESQLFGHVRGAFTGAERDRLGYIRAAHGGTLFLDEVGDMPPGLQTRLLRVLQERSVIPVGQTEPVPVDLRVLAATHRDLPLMVRTGKFREDLFYRLSAFRLIVPSLQERPDDIIPLAEHFLDLQAAIYEEPRRRLSSRAEAWLQAQRWRGNVRELANAIEYALVASDGDDLAPEDFPEPMLAEAGLGQSVFAAGDGSAQAPGARVLTLRQAEWQAVANALQVAGGDKTRAARLLRISRSRLYSILARQDLDDRSSSSRSAS